MAQAAALVPELGNGLLMGHVLAQRYLHPTGYRATFQELKDWLDLYTDHPQAEKIYKLALMRAPSGAEKSLQKPQEISPIGGNLGKIAPPRKKYKSRKHRSAAQEAALSKLSHAIRVHAQNDEPTQGLQRLAEAKYLDKVEYDGLRAVVASGFLYARKIDEAERHALASLERSGEKVPQAGWIYGLANWEQGDFTEAAAGFASAASSPYASGWMVSAASYWAARSHMKGGKQRKVSRWLRKAAAHPRTFYGLIAQRALGYDAEFSWDVPDLTGKRKAYILSFPAGKRAEALLRAGQVDMAEAELNRRSIVSTGEKKKALLAYAVQNDLPALTLRLGNTVRNSEGEPYAAALYPFLPWVPESGYKVDKALIHALVRQESRFNMSAKNPSGATGLMQLMPATAGYVAGTSLYEDKAGMERLREPQVNLEIGQTYVNRLLDHGVVGRDLLLLTIAYNAGPGKLSRWKKERAGLSDPLLFIESIPYTETRAFVERVLSNYWIYRMRFQQPTPSLDAVTSGRWARYAAMDTNEGLRYATR